MEAEPDVTPVEAPDAADAEQPPAKTPRMVRRVACIYRLDALPGAWLQAWRRLDRVLVRAKFDVKATLDPIENLPEAADILVVPPELRAEVLEKVRPGVPILVTSAETAAGAFNDLLRRLEEGIEVTAEKIEPEARAAAAKIVRYRGSTRLE
jgi:hypothetical protein